MEDPKKRNVPTWRPPPGREDMTSGIYPVDEGTFEPVVMPRQTARARGAKVAPLRTRWRRG